jgi:hypothetical protein
MENKPEEIIGLDEKIARLSKLLEKVGVVGAEDFIKRAVIPVMMEKKCSILEAINEYPDGEEESPHFHELYFALKRIPPKELEFLK